MLKSQHEIVSSRSQHNFTQFVEEAEGCDCSVCLFDGELL